MNRYLTIYVVGWLLAFAAQSYLSKREDSYFEDIPLPGIFFFSLIWPFGVVIGGPIVVLNGLHTWLANLGRRHQRQRVEREQARRRELEEERRWVAEAEAETNRLLMEKP